MAQNTVNAACGNLENEDFKTMEKNTAKTTEQRTAEEYLEQLNNAYQESPEKLIGIINEAFLKVQEDCLKSSLVDDKAELFFLKFFWKYTKEVEKLFMSKEEIKDLAKGGYYMEAQYYFGFTDKSSVRGIPVRPAAKRLDEYDFISSKVISFRDTNYLRDNTNWFRALISKDSPLWKKEVIDAVRSHFADMPPYMFSCQDDYDNQRIYHATAEDAAKINQAVHNCETKRRIIRQNRGNEKARAIVARHRPTLKKCLDPIANIERRAWASIFN